MAVSTKLRQPPAGPGQDLSLRAMEASFFWPKHWQKVIYKIHANKHPLWMGTHYKVLAKNPEYVHAVSLARPYSQQTLPPMYLTGPIEFDSIEELDAWARVAARID